MFHATTGGRRAVALALALTAAIAAPASAATHPTQQVKVRFAAVAGSQPVTCGKLIDALGKTGQSAQLQDLRFYVSDVRLIRREGRAVPVRLRGDGRFQTTRKGHSVSLIDLENARGACSAGTPGQNVDVRGTVPAGRYRGVRFNVGVPFALNHTDVVSAPAPLNLAGMAWSWQYGRKFAKIEIGDPGGANGSWASHAFLVHLGSTGCTGNPATGAAVRCTAPNMPTVTLRRFDARKQTVALDIRALLAGDDITSSDTMGAGMQGDQGMQGMEGMEPGCMSGSTTAACGPIFRALGLNWRADGSGTGEPAGKQAVFRAIGR